VLDGIQTAEVTIQSERLVPLGDAGFAAIIEESSL
jgi:hypothetical protein